MLVEGMIKNEVYEKLIEYSFQKCDALMFIFRKDGFNDSQKQMVDIQTEKVKNDFSNSCLKVRDGAHWVFTKVGYSQLNISGYEDPPFFEKLFEIFFYQTTEKLKQYLLFNKNLYEWNNPKWPEDISFFKNGYCWLYSVTHENFCYIYCENKEEYEYLKSIGIEFQEKEFKSTPKNELYYENYNIKS